MTDNMNNMNIAYNRSQMMNMNMNMNQGGNQFQKSPKKNPSSGNVIDIMKKSNGQNRVMIKPKKKNVSSGTIVENIKRGNIEDEAEEEFEKFLERIGSELVSFIKTQKGSRYMQKYLNKITPDNINLLLSKICTSFKEIMTDSYGNYFIQKLTQCCSSHQRVVILMNVRIINNIQVSEEFLEIAVNTAGTHSLQSLIEIVNLEEEEVIIRKAVEPNILKLSYNSNGTHIIQKIITCFDERSRMFLNDYIIENLCKVCMNANGICVVKLFY